MPAEVRRLPVQPHSIEAEQAVLGALLIDETAWARVSQELTGADFYEKRHQQIYAAIAWLHGEGKAVDAVTVAEHIGRQTVGEQGSGLAYIATLARDTPTAANAESYAGIIRERAAMRRLRKCGEDLVWAVDESAGRTPLELTTTLQERILQLQSRLRQGRGLVASADLVGELVDDLDRRSSGQRGLMLGLADLDQLTCGLDPGDLVVIAGRPGMGKTALLVSIAARVSLQRAVAVFSAEMPSRQLMRRCLSLVSGIAQGKLRSPEDLTDQDWATITSGTGELSNRRLWIDDTAQPELQHIRSEVAALKGRTDLGLVLVDYVQLVSGRGRNRYEELRDVAYGLKAMAKDLAVPIIVLAQLNRDVEARDKKRPSISDLRDSGAIEEAADIIGLLYSEGYYNPQHSMPYVLECNIGKNRNGERGQCLWSFAGDRSKVDVLDSGAAIQYRRVLAEASSSRKPSADL